MLNQLAEGFGVAVGKVGMVGGRAPKPPPRPPDGARPPKPLPRPPYGVRPAKLPNGVPGPGMRWGMARGTLGSKLALSQTHFASVRAPASAVAVGMRLVLTHAFAASGVSMLGTTR